VRCVRGGGGNLVIEAEKQKKLKGKGVRRKKREKRMKKKGPNKIIKINVSHWPAWRG